MQCSSHNETEKTPNFEAMKAYEMVGCVVRRPLSDSRSKFEINVQTKLQDIRGHHLVILVQRQQ